MEKSRHSENGARRVLGWLVTWGPVLVWMGIIFYLSGTNTWTAQKGPPAYQAFRKSGHILEYGVLALLVGWALYATLKKPGEIPSKAFLLRVWGVGVVLCTLYAATDEIHQAFVPRREFHLTDILIDALSATAALGVWYIAKIELMRRAHRSERTQRDAVH
jgi:VanZ family protein